MRKQAELERKGGTVQEFAQPVGTTEVSDAAAAALVAEIIGIAKTLKEDSDMTLNELSLIVSIDEPIQGAANMGIEVRTPRRGRPPWPRPGPPRGARARPAGARVGGEEQPLQYHQMRSLIEAMPMKRFSLV